MGWGEREQYEANENECKYWENDMNICNNIVYIHKKWENEIKI